MSRLWLLRVGLESLEERGVTPLQSTRLQGVAIAGPALDRKEVSGCGHRPVKSDAEAIDRRYLSYMPGGRARPRAATASWRRLAPTAARREP